MLGPGEYPIGWGSTLKIVGRPVGDRKTNDAQILFAALEETGRIAPESHKFEIPEGWGTWAIVCRSSDRFFYLLHKGGVRKIDFSSPRKVTDTPANDLPAEFLDEVKRQFDIHEISAAQQAEILEKAAHATADEQDLRHIERLQGTWQVVEAHVGGTHAPRESSKEQVWKFDHDKLVFDFGDGDPMEMTYRIDEKQDPATIDLSPLGPREKGSLYKGIYQLDGDALKVHFTRNSAIDSRPQKLEPGDDRGMRYFVLKRAQKSGVQEEAPKPKQGVLLKSATEEKLKWGEPENGLRAALMMHPVEDEPDAEDQNDIFLVVQNVSQAKIWLHSSDAAPNPRQLIWRDHGVLETITETAQPIPADYHLQPGEAAFFRMLLPPGTRNPGGRSTGSIIAESIHGDPDFDLTGKMEIETAPAGAWTGKLLSGEIKGGTAIPVVLPEENQTGRATKPAAKLPGENTVRARHGK